MIQFYYYKHPKTGQIFSDQRMSNFKEKPYISSDGVECELLEGYIPPPKEFNDKVCIIDKNAEVFKKDPDYCKKLKPKYIQFKDGHKERYDPTRHC